MFFFIEMCVAKAESFQKCLCVFLRLTARARPEAGHKAEIQIGGSFNLLEFLTSQLISHGRAIDISCSILVCVMTIRKN